MGSLKFQKVTAFRNLLKKNIELLGVLVRELTCDPTMAKEIQAWMSSRTNFLGDKRKA